MSSSSSGGGGGGGGGMYMAESPEPEAPRRLEERMRAAYSDPEVDAALRVECGYGGAPFKASTRLLPHQLKFFTETAIPHFMGLSAQEVPGLLLGWEMGLGKTLMAVTYALATRPFGSDRPTLMVLPAILIEAHQKDIAKFFDGVRVGVARGGKVPDPTQKWDFVLTTYETLASAFKSSGARTGKARRAAPVGYTGAHALARYFFGPGAAFWAMVLDESAHKIANLDSLRSRAVRAVASRRTVLLTGTPVVNSTKDILAQLVTMGAKDINEEADTDLANVFFPLTKADAGIVLPKCTHIHTSVEMNPTETAIHTSGAEWLRALKGQLAGLAGRGGPAARARRRALTNQLHATHTILQMLTLTGVGIAKKQKTLDNVMRNFQLGEEMKGVFKDPNGLLGRGASKVQAVAARLVRLAGARAACVVFSSHIPFLETMAKLLQERNIAAVLLTGQTPDREKVIDGVRRRVRKGEAVMLLATDKLGMGWNLPAVHNVVIANPTWTDADVAQCVARCHRIGQTRDVTVYHFTTAGSLEESKTSASNRKRGAMDHVMQHKKLQKKDQKDKVVVGEVIDLTQDMEEEEEEEEEADVAIDRTGAIKPFKAIAPMAPMPIPVEVHVIDLVD